MTVLQDLEKPHIASSPSSTIHVANLEDNDKYLVSNLFVLPRALVDAQQVTFEEYDERDPMNFSYKTKWTVTLVACAFSGIVGKILFTAEPPVTETFLCL